MTDMRLKCVLLLPLQEMALRRVAVLLWSGLDILTEISKLEFWSPIGKGIKLIGNKVKEKVCKLELPESLLKQVIEVVEPFSMKIVRWKYFKFCLSLSPEATLSVLLKLRWTTAGDIDDRKTAEGLVHCNALSVEQRYEIACQNCLVDYIPLLWEKIPVIRKKCYLNCKYLTLEFCWPHILSGEVSNLDHLWRTSDRNLTSFNQCSFEYSADRGNKVAAEYFFQKLTHEERETSLTRTALAVNWKKFEMFKKAGEEIEKLLDTFCYLLSLMTPKQQMEVLNARPADVFLCFLHWPRQNLFLHNASTVLNFVPPTRHAELLCGMADELASADFYVPKLFQEFFRQIPLHLKKVFVDEAYFPACRFLSVFFDSDDSDSIKVLFRNVDAADRVKILFHNGVSKLLIKGLIGLYNHRSALVKLCLQEASLSREDWERLKDHLSWINRVTEISNNMFLKHFFESLDATNEWSLKEKKAAKRKLENCGQE